MGSRDAQDRGLTVVLGSSNDDADADAAADAALTLDYLLLTVASCVIATLGLLENSAAVIIGAMIIAPFIVPIQGFAHASLAGDGAVVRRALLTTAIGAGIAVASSAAIGAVVAFGTYGSEVTARTRPTLLDLGIAVAAGAVAGLAKVRPQIGTVVPGTAIAVALMPPLCVVGLALARGNGSWATGAGLLFGTNFLGIALACMVVFLAVGRVGRHNALALTTTAIVTAGLVFPLGASFAEIVREQRIEADVRSELATQTVTFRSVRILSASFDWYTSPVTVRLEASASHPITPGQVADLEQFVHARTGRTIRLILDVIRYRSVTDAISAPATAAPDPANAAAPAAP